MIRQGIRILDKEKNVISVKLLDILDIIPNGNLFYWSILYLRAIGHLDEGKSMPFFEEQINKSEKGLYISWEELKSLAKMFYQEIDLILIGNKNQQSLCRYQSETEMCENCDIVIQMIDSSYWEVFSKDKDVIEKLASNFKQIKFLTTN